MSHHMAMFNKRGRPIPTGSRVWAQGVKGSSLLPQRNIDCWYGERTTGDREVAAARSLSKATKVSISGPRACPNPDRSEADQQGAGPAWMSTKQCRGMGEAIFIRCQRPVRLHDCK